MIKKLRVKFVLIAMVSVTAVLSIIVGGINIANYVSINKNADAIAGILLDNGGRFPSAQLPGMSAETPYETRYFSVRLLRRGSILYCDVSQIASIDKDGAVALAKEFAEQGKAHGRYGDYKYDSRLLSDESTLYVFVDLGRDLSTFRNFLLLSILISLAGLMAVLVLVVILSAFVLRPVEESYRKQRAFITNASHDLKTPLTVIGAEAEMLEMQNGESEWTSDIKKQVKRLTSLTEKLVLLSRMEEGDSLEMRPFDLSNALSDTVASYVAPAKESGHEICAGIQSGVEYVGDRERIVQAFALILDNAVKYASEGDIEVSLKKSGKSVEISFSNFAHDMKKGAHNELFERFYRADSSRSSKGGNGIGLSVVKAIVEAHRGSISAHSPEDGLIKFTLVF